MQIWEHILMIVYILIAYFTAILHTYFDRFEVKKSLALVLTKEYDTFENFEKS